MISAIKVLQLLSGILWLMPALAMAPGIGRTWTNRATVLDLLCTPMFFTSCIFVAGAFRWWYWPSALTGMKPDELSFWAGIYIVSSFCAIGVLWSYLAAKKR